MHHFPEFIEDFDDVILSSLSGNSRTSISLGLVSRDLSCSFIRPHLRLQVSLCWDPHI